MSRERSSAQLICVLPVRVAFFRGHCCGTGEEAQIIIEEVANLLRSSTSSGNGPTMATRATSMASDLTSSLHSTQGPASTPAGPGSSHANELSFSALTEELPHANTEPDPHAAGESLLHRTLILLTSCPARGPAQAALAAQYAYCAA